MDERGYQRVNKAFSQETYKPTISPVPGPNEDVPYVTIETEPSVPPALVLNALHHAGLMYNTRNMQPPRPELEIVNIVPGSATFRDMASKNKESRFNFQ